MLHPTLTLVVGMAAVRLVLCCALRFQEESHMVEHLLQDMTRCSLVRCESTVNLSKSCHFSSRIRKPTLLLVRLQHKLWNSCWRAAYKLDQRLTSPIQNDVSYSCIPSTVEERLCT